MDEAMAEHTLDLVSEWAEQHRVEVQEAIKELDRPEVKGLVIEGAPHSGKTSLALAVAREFEKRGNQSFFTTPAVQQTFGAVPSSDRTGARYEKLPRQMNTSPEQTNLIVIDEISQRRPTPEGKWGGYIDSDNTKFIVLTHPGNATTDDWINAFGSNQLSFFSLGQQ